MARNGTLKNACFRLLSVGLLALMFVMPVLAQDEAAEENPTAAKFAKIQASSDSLGFGSTAADSLQEVPVIIEPLGGIMGIIDRSAIGQTGLGKKFVAGGPFMIPIFLVALVGLIFIIERGWTLYRARVNTRRLIGTIITTLRSDGVQAAAEECQKVRGPIAAILYSGLQKADKGRESVEKAIATAGTIEMSFLERGLIWISSVTTIAPLMGFLGTVSGMINAFDAIAASEQVNAKLVASGISEALITTASGLIVAIPATIGYNYFVSAIDRFVIEMEETSAELIEELERMKG
jgi:biopolymer transport protein ExbB|nr:MotA/TolQ/ExbB proton channel family protein [Candidatus Krumholzibacteria bacterium]